MDFDFVIIEDIDNIDLDEIILEEYVVTDEELEELRAYHDCDWIFEKRIVDKNWTENGF